MSYRGISEREHVARKAHRCIWCTEPIVPGEKYIREASIYDGDFQNHKWHHECNAAACHYFQTEDEEFEAHSHKRGTCEEP